MDGNVNEGLQPALAQVQNLYKLPYRNAEFQPWLDKTTTLLKEMFGEASAEVWRFVNATGKTFVIGTETGRMQEYQRRLEAYEETLRELLEK